jgi:hypothetical protein
MKLNKKQKRTLEALFIKPAPHLQIVWWDIEQLVLACGGQMLEGSGSAIRLVLGRQCAYLHRPHLCKETKAYQVKAIRDLLKSAGIVPDTVG